jgi:hypothetical protein
LQEDSAWIDVYLRGIVVNILMRYRLEKVAKDTFLLIRDMGVVACVCGYPAVKVVVQQACG